MWQHVAGGQGEWEYLPLDELEGAEVCVAPAPLESALVTTIATVRGRRELGALRRRDVEALRPLIDYRTRAWPSSLTHRRDERDFAASVDAGIRGGRLHAGVWAPVLDAPERWLRGYAAAMERVWAEVEPRWRRATILRALDRPVSAGDLAERHGFSPSGITHHLGALERAGLVVRERDGRRVVVQRTPRGTRLLALYE